MLQIKEMDELWQRNQGKDTTQLKKNHKCEIKISSPDLYTFF